MTTYRSQEYWRRSEACMSELSFPKHFLKALFKRPLTSATGGTMVEQEMLLSCAYPQEKCK